MKLAGKIEGIDLYFGTVTEVLSWESPRWAWYVRDQHDDTTNFKILFVDGSLYVEKWHLSRHLVENAARYVASIRTAARQNNAAEFVACTQYLTAMFGADGANVALTAWNYYRRPISMCDGERRGLVDQCTDMLCCFNNKDLLSQAREEIRRLFGLDEDRDDQAAGQAVKKGGEDSEEKN